MQCLQVSTNSALVQGRRETRRKKFATLNTLVKTEAVHRWGRGAIPGGSESPTQSTPSPNPPADLEQSEYIVQRER